jgi:hypothetical protein
MAGRTSECGKVRNVPSRNPKAEHFADRGATFGALNIHYE